MKRLISNLNIAPFIFNFEMITYHPVLDDPDESNIAASDGTSKPNLPKGPVISKVKNRITQSMVNDFEAFVENIESLCEDNHKLIGTYKHVSKDNSYYYNYLAQDNKGNIIIDCRLRLRISNHEAKSTKQQQKKKKDELDSEILHKLLSQKQIDNLHSYAKVIIINDELFEDYDEAYEYAIKIIDHAVEVMKRKARN